MAALMAWKLTVTEAMNTTNIAEEPKNHQFNEIL